MANQMPSTLDMTSAFNYYNYSCFNDYCYYHLYFYYYYYYYHYYYYYYYYYYYCYYHHYYYYYYVSYYASYCWPSLQAQVQFVVFITGFSLSTFSCSFPYPIQLHALFADQSGGIQYSCA